MTESRVREVLSITDPHQRAHIEREGAYLIDFCTCRTDKDGSRYFTCKRKACDGRGKACGGYCHPCFQRHMQVAGTRPEVVVLCGSTRFRADFEREVVRLGLEGKIVLNVSCYGHSGDLPPEACIDGHPTKTALDELHKRKIDMADRVLVINPGGYIGSSTRSEIEYAEWFEKPIDYLVAPAVAIAHDCGHMCCDERHDPMHDHFLAADNCPSCVSGTP